VLSDLLKWNVVPTTEIAEGPLGIGSFQEWVDAKVSEVDIFNPTEVPENWLTVISGVDDTGNLVTLAHNDRLDLRQIAILDALANNADRKAGHLITDLSDKTWAIDHGVTFNTDPKLRTVLWGWLGNEIPNYLLKDLASFLSLIDQSELVSLLTNDEVRALISRTENVIETAKFPAPNPNWPAVPWPIF